MTHKINLGNPQAHNQEILGESAFDFQRAFPGQSFMFPFQHFVRMAFTNHTEAFEAGAEFTVPGYGVLTTSGRAYSFNTTEQYRKAKDYPETITGSWG